MYVEPTRHAGKHCLVTGMIKQHPGITGWNGNPKREIVPAGEYENPRYPYDHYDRYENGHNLF
jgi:hypothetical protein